MASTGERLQKIRNSSGDTKDRAIKDAFRDGISASKIAEAAKVNRIDLIKKLGKEGW